MRVSLFSICVISLLSQLGQAGELSPLEKLGKQIFFDPNLSSPAGQSCASCHDPETGFSGPNSTTNRQTAVYPGAVSQRAGNRKPPSVAYASFSPAFSYDEFDETYVGGQFWDGRARDLVEQAKGPFLNPLEMNNETATDVVTKVLNSSYRPLFDSVHGAAAQNADAEVIFDLIAQSIAAYEASSEVNSFSSKYDAYLAGLTTLSNQEQRGLDLFINKANCTACHPHDPDSDGNPPLFTDFTYDNVGAPRNRGNPYYHMPADVNPQGESYRDLGLGGSLKQPEQWGQVKVPTLRNIAKRPKAEFTKSFLHNGAFKSIKEVVHFYNTRDTAPEQFDPPDVIENVNRDELGDLGLTDAEENDLVAFLETLSDGYFDPTSGLQVPGPVADSGGLPQSINSRFRGAADVVRARRFMERHTTIAREREQTVR